MPAPIVKRPKKTSPAPPIPTAKCRRCGADADLGRCCTRCGNFMEMPKANPPSIRATTGPWRAEGFEILSPSGLIAEFVSTEDGLALCNARVAAEAPRMARALWRVREAVRESVQNGEPVNGAWLDIIASEALKSVGL